MSKFDREVEVPALGDDAYMIFGLSEMEEFEALYGENYVQIIIAGVDRGTISIMRKCLELMLKESVMKADDILEQHSFAEVGMWIVDAISLSVHGKRLSAL